MRIDYDQDHDTVYIRLHATPRAGESDEIESGVIVDYGPEGQVSGVELMDAHRRGPWTEWVQWGDALQARVTRS